MGTPVLAGGASVRDGRRRVVARVGVVAALVVALVAGGLTGLTVTAPPAKANVSTVIPSDSSGFPNDNFSNTDGLYALAIVDITGGRICIVDEADSHGCDKPAWAHTHPVLGIGTLEILMKAPELKVGTWRLRAEVLSGDTWVESALSDPFTVYPCVGGGCANSFEAAQAQAFKDRFGNIKDASDSFCLASATTDVLGEEKWSGRAKKLGEGIKQYQDTQPSWGAGILAVGLGGALAFMPDIQLPTTQKAIELLKDISCRASAMAAAIRADPPDPAYNQIAQPQFASIPSAPFTDPNDLAIAVSLDRQDAYGVALLHAYERFQGASNAGDQSWKRQQARAIADNTQALANEMRTTSSLLRTKAAAVAAAPGGSDPVLTAAEKADWVIVFQRVRSSGFTASELTDLQNLGYTASQIDAIRQHFNQPIEDFPADTSYAAIINSYADILSADSTPLDDFANRADAIATNDQPPSADFLVENQGGGVVKVTQQASSPDGDALSYDWDFGDGTTASGATATHTYTSSGSFPITLTVHEPFLQASVTKVVPVTLTVASANPDAVTVTAGTPGSVNVLTNDSAPPGQTLSVSAFDATGSKGSPVSCTNAGVCTITPAPEAFGTEQFNYTAAASGGSTASAAVTVTVNGLPPTAVADTASTDMDVAVSVPVLDNDSAPTGDTLSLVTTSTTSAAGGAVTCAVDSCQYTPPAAFVGMDSFLYTVARTNAGTQATALVTVLVHGGAVDLPTAVDDTATMVKNGSAITVDVLANDTAPSGATIAVSDHSPSAAGGVVSCSATDCSYTPPTDFVGTDQFAYQVTATPGGGAAVAVVTVTITPPPPPTAVADTASVDPGQNINIPVAANDTFIPGDAIQSLVAEPPTSARGVTPSCSVSGCSYTAPIRTRGTDTFTYRVTAQSGASAVAEVTVTINGTVPVATNDAVTVRGAAAFDILDNDSNTDGDPLAIANITQPANGTAQCDPRGGCLYTPNPGYLGADSFTYTLDDAEGPATATVSLNVVASGAGNLPPIAPPDIIATVGTTPGMVNVLANDTDVNGDTLSLVVASTSTPSHGMVDCTADGACTYTADDGFTGIDTFTYVVTDGAANTTGQVQVRVTPPGAGFNPTAHGQAAVGGGGAIQAGEAASWVVGLAPNQDGLPQELTGPLAATTVTPALTGAQMLDPASVTPAPGWSYDPGTGAFRPVVNPDGSTAALLGNATQDVLPKPFAAASQGTGGDGHVPILVGSKVFALFHHSWPTQISCVDRATGAMCPGYPKPILQGTTDYNGGGAVFGTKFWTNVYSLGNPSWAPVSLLCWDSVLDQPCGLVNVARTQATGMIMASPPVRVGDNAYVAAGDGNLYCINGSTGEPCAVPKIATGATAPWGWQLDVVTHGTRVFVDSEYGNKTACIDVATGQACTGWETPKTLDANNIWNMHDGTGAAVGVCAVSHGHMTCVRDDTPSTVSTFYGPLWPENHYSASLEAESGARTVYGNNGAGIGCWDWAVMGACVGGRWDANSWMFTDNQGTGIPRAYGAAWDGTCVIALGDPGIVYSVDPAGASPCTSLNSGTARTVDLRSQRCDGTVGAATWDKVRVTDVDLGPGVNFSSLVVTVKDAQTGAVLRSVDVVGTTGELDISDIDPVAHPSLVLATSGLSVLGNPAWANGQAPKVTLTWHSDPAAGCFRTTTAPACSFAPGESPLAVAATADPAADPNQNPATATVAINPVPCSPRYHPIAPSRILDTRDGTGAPQARIGPGQEVVLDVTGLAGVPATGVASVVLNVTATGATETSHLRIYPDGMPTPLVSSLNFDANETIAASVVATVGTNGNIRIFNNSGSVDVIADVSGWFDLGLASTGSRYHPLSPTRILDTRDGTGAPQGPLAGGATIDLDVTGVGGVPETGVSAVAINLTATGPSEESHLRVWPEGPTPLVANLNFGQGVTIANLSLATVGSDGHIRIFNNSGQVEVVGDVVGWFDLGGVDGPGTSGDSYHAIPPARILDTRDGTGAPVGKLGPGATVSVAATGQGGVPPTGVDAVVVSLTADRPTAGSHLRSWPSGEALPLVSSLNFAAGDAVANLVVAKVGADGRFQVYNNSGQTHVIVDVQGWFGPAADTLPGGP